jgi:hypothetical protein
VSSTPSVDGDDLDVADGLHILIDRAFDHLPTGAILEVRSRAPSVAHDLPAWCRVSGHEYLGAIEGGHRVRRGAPRRFHDRATAPQNDPPRHADPTTGFAPRGAAVESDAPAYPFTILTRDDVWADDAADLYTQAITSQWTRDDIPWASLPKLPSELELAVAQSMTFLAENEFSALYVPAKFVPRIHPHFGEVVLFLATQIADEARHIDVFTRRAVAGGATLGRSTTTTQVSLKTLLDQEDFTAASFLLSVLGEGTFLDLLRYLEEHAPDPVTAEIVRRARHDEARHVRFGLSHVRGYLASGAEHPAALVAAVKARAGVLSGATSVNPLVQDALAILGGAGITASSIRRGVAATRELLTTMHENRRKRLVACGFPPELAEELSGLHTPNFM